MTRPPLRATTKLAWLTVLPCGIYLLLDLARPMGYDEEDEAPLLSWLTGADLTLRRATLIGLAVACLAQPLIWFVGWLWRRHSRQPDRVRKLVTVISSALLLFPLTFDVIAVIVIDRAAVALCLPTTMFALWGAHRLQYYRRMPWTMTVAAFLGGACLGTGLGALTNTLISDFAPYYLYAAFPPSTMADVVQIQHHTTTLVYLNAGILEELGKALPVALIVLWRRDRIDGLVSGLVLGAASGLGFNLVESATYMVSPSTDSAGMQFWLRQVVGVMGAHTAFAAVAGAGIGAATQLADHRLRRTAVTCCLLLACGGHALNDIALRWFNQEIRYWAWVSDNLNTLVIQPGMLLILQGPIVVVYVVLLRRGLRDQAAGLTAELTAEASTATGAITSNEIPVLMNPAVRRWLGLVIWRRHGWAARRNLIRLHTAQLDLAGHRWHCSRGDWRPGETITTQERALTTRIGQLKARHAELISPVRAAMAGVAQ